MKATTTNTARSCWVCGLEAALRCPDCNDWDLEIAFCSRDHQKLVWPVHKAVCGDNCMPFLFPPLSSAEVEEAQKHIQTSYGNGPYAQTNLMMRLGSLYPGMPLAEMSERIEAVGPFRPEPDISLPYYQEMLANIRASESLRTVLLNPIPAERPPSYLHYPLQLCSLITSTSFYAKGPVAEPIPPWRSILMHRILVATALGMLSLEAPHQSELLAYHKYAFEEVKRYINKAVMFRAPDEAKHALDTLDRYALGPDSRQTIQPTCIVS